MPRPSSETEINSTFSTWAQRFAARFEGEASATLRNYHEALLGEGLSPPRSAQEVSGYFATTLPKTWGAFFRPMADGRTGAALARESGLFDREPSTSALERVEQSHGVLADVVAVDLRRHLYTLRSLLDGAIYHVPSPPEFMRGMHRWMRVMTLLVDRGDGFWCQPSVIAGGNFSSNITLEKVWAEVIDRAARLGLPAPPAAPTPHALARYLGLVHAAFVRQSIPTEEQERQSRKKRFAVNSDGDRVEYQTVELDWHKDDRAALRRASEQGGVFRAHGPQQWLWVGQGAVHRSGQSQETLAELSESEQRWTLTASSPQRIARAMEHLSAALGRSPAVQHTGTVRPWEQNPGLASEESDDTVRIVLSTSFQGNDRAVALKSMREGVLDALRASMGQSIPLIGGRPRELAQTPEGRTKVEEWLRFAETNGVPARDDVTPRYLDLDPFRVELGLPTVASTFPPAPPGDVGLPPAPLAPRLPFAAPPVAQLSSSRVGRNDPCPCGSGKKFKKCCY